MGISVVVVSFSVETVSGTVLVLMLVLVLLLVLLLVLVPALFSVASSGLRVEVEGTPNV
jgi:hypothetical protein